MGRSCLAAGVMSVLIGGAAAVGAESRTIGPARGHARPVERIDPETLRSACRAGGDFLAGLQQPDGRFRYAYFPLTDRYVISRYNLLRHAGTTMACFQLARATREARYAEVGRRALKWLETQCRRQETAEGPLIYAVDAGRAKVGGIALTALALLEAHDHQADPDALDRAAGLGRALLASQGPDGMFGLYYRPGTEVRYREQEGESEYYPGEACLALVRLFAATRQAVWLEGARRTANDLLGPRHQRRAQAGLPVPLHDHWFLYALEWLYRADTDPRYLEHARLVARDIVDTQITAADARYADEIGGWARVPAPECAPAATRLEGLCAAYRLLAMAGQPTDWMLPAIRSASRFLLQLQFRPDNAASFPAPGRLLGGFSHSALRPDIRIDYVQHAIAGLLAAADILEAAQTQKR